MRDLDYLKLLSREYPSVKTACSEIINLTAIQGLPKSMRPSSTCCGARRGSSGRRSGTPSDTSSPRRSRWSWPT